MEKLILSFLLFFCIQFAVEAGVQKISFQLPNVKENWILNTYASGRLVVVFHKQSVSVSQDYGRTFSESFFNKKIKFDIQPNQAFIQIDENNERIFTVYYKNSFFNSSIPATGLVYEYEKNNEILRLSSVLVPRLGFIDFKSQLIYFSSFNEVSIASL